MWNLQSYPTTVLNNDLTAGCLVYKVEDDTTLSEIIPKGGCGNMTTILSDVVVVKWSRNNLMILSGTKLKKFGLVWIQSCLGRLMFCMLTTISSKEFILLSCLLLSLSINLKWSAHVDSICAKASSRLYFLKILKRSLLSTDDLLYFYMSAVRPLLEYACPVWHTSLTKEQSGQIESI